MVSVTKILQGLIGPFSLLNKLLRTFIFITEHFARICNLTLFIHKLIHIL